VGTEILKERTEAIVKKGDTVQDTVFCRKNFSGHNFLDRTKSVVLFFMG